MNEEQNTKPTREEILAASREENKKGDERQSLYAAKVNVIAFSVGFVLAAIIFTVSSIMDHHYPLEILLVLAATQAVQNLITAFNKTKDRKTSVILGIIGFIEALIAILYLVYWILQRCGVM